MFGHFPTLYKKDCAVKRVSTYWLMFFCSQKNSLEATPGMPATITTTATVTPQDDKPKLTPKVSFKVIFSCC